MISWLSHIYLAQYGQYFPRFSYLCEKKGNYLSDAGTDPRIIKSSTLLKLGLGNDNKKLL